MQYFQTLQLTGSETTKYDVLEAAKHGAEKCFQVLLPEVTARHELFQVYSYAARRGSIKIMELAHAARGNTDRFIFPTLILSVVPINSHPSLCKEAAIGGNVECLHFAYNNGCKFVTTAALSFTKNRIH